MLLDALVLASRRPSVRSEAGYPLYGPKALGRIGFIQRAKALGLTLREVPLRVQQPTEPGTDLTRLRHAFAHKLVDTRRRIAELETLRAELEALHGRLGGLRPPCGHLGDCSYWLPTGEEMGCMATSEPTGTNTYNRWTARARATATAAAAAAPESCCEPE